MGQKVNPIGLRLGINRTWDSRWFARKDYSNLLHEDLKLRKFLNERLLQAGVARIVIERAAKKTRITIHSARPGVVIGKKGADIEKLRSDIAKMTATEVSLNIVEIRKPEIDAKLIADGIAQQLERRVAFRRAMKRAVQSAMRLGALGIRINCSGRLGGAEIARMEWYREGRVPLHTLRANVDFGYGTAKTTYGICGVKVWVFKGEILAHDPMAQDKLLGEQQQGAGAWLGQGRHYAQFWRLWPKGRRAGPHHGAPDRGGSPHDHPFHPPCRPCLDPHFSGCTGIDKAGGSPHGQWQGLAGILDRAGQAGPHHVRTGRCRAGCSARGFRACLRQTADRDQVHNSGG